MANERSEGSGLPELPEWIKESLNKHGWEWINGYGSDERVGGAFLASSEKDLLQETIQDVEKLLNERGIQGWVLFITKNNPDAVQKGHEAVEVTTGSHPYFMTRAVHRLLQILNKMAEEGKDGTD